MHAKTIRLNRSISYEILSKDQIIIHRSGAGEYLHINGVCFELMVALMNLKKVDYSEFLSTYCDKYKKLSRIEFQITQFLKKLAKFKIISLR